jgi:multiple antibiotic resistance protein
MPLWKVLSSDTILALATLVSIINPLGIAFVFREMTIWATPSERAALSRRIALYSLAVILSSYFFGNLVLGFFGIGVPSLRIAGGIVVATSGFALLNAPDPGAGASAPQAMDTAPVMQMAFFPLTMPLTTGPGTISVAIALGAGRSERTGAEVFSAATGFVAAAMVMAALIWFCYRNADRLSRVVGVEGTRVVTRLSAFLLLCVGVQIIATGVTELVQPLLAGR